MSTFLNKNLFKTTFLLLILAEILSFFGWLLPQFGNICFFVILFLFLILSLKKLEYGLYIIFAELFIGSKGYLFSLEIDNTLISVRIGLFIIIMSIWLMKEIKKLRNGEIQGLKNNKHLKKFFLLFGIILWAFIWGIIRNNNFGNVFFDFNNWLYFLLIFPAWYVARKNNNFIKSILSILIACVVWLGIKSLILLYIFSHEFIWALPEVYKWIRDTGAGEITRAGNGFYRIFIQSQIYSLFLFFILLPKVISDQLLVIRKNKFCSLFTNHYLLLIICLTTIILSFSRSYWVALIIGLIFYFIIKLLITHYSLLITIKSLVKILLIAIVSFTIVFAVINLPPKTSGGNLVSMLGKRATEMEAASSSRINQLKPLLREIIKHPIIGSGFGTTVTYKSDDPRILGDYTTYAFEWGYLDMILKFGIFGFGIYLFIILRILQRLLIPNFQFLISNKILNSKFQILNSIKFGFALALIALLIVNIFSPYLNHPLGIGFIIIATIL